MGNHFFKLLGIVTYLSLVTAVSTAWAVDTAPRTETRPPSTARESKPTPEPSVAKVTPEKVRLGHDLHIVLPGLGETVKKNPKLLLYLDGRVVKGIAPEIDIARDTLNFTLQRNDESRVALNRLLGAPKAPWERTVSVSVGTENSQFPSTHTVKLVVLLKKTSYLWLLFITMISVFFLYFAPRTEILRNYDKNSPYSLALVQMAFWFFVIIVSYLFINAITGEWDLIPESMLVLLGIAGGTMLGARVIDDSKVNAMKTESRNLQNQLVTLKGQTPPADAQIAAVQQQISDTETAINRLLSSKSKGFLSDILNDANGISLHRFQIVVWTLAFGIIFLGKVYNELAMPALSATQLALIGISSATYLGFKLPEQH